MHDGGSTETISILEQPPAKRRKPCPEDHPGIDGVWLFDDFFFQAAGGFIYHDINHAFERLIGIESLPALRREQFLNLRVGPAFFRIDIKSPAGFFAQKPLSINFFKNTIRFKTLP